MRLLFAIAFLLCLKESEGQKKLSVKQIDSIVHLEKKYKCVDGGDLSKVDSSLSAFKALYCIGQSSNKVKLLRAFINEKNKVLMQYKYFFINNQLAKVEFLLNGSCNCLGEYYFSNNHLLYKKEKNIEVQNTDTFLKVGNILISKANSRFKK